MNQNRDSYCEIVKERERERKQGIEEVDQKELIFKINIRFISRKTKRVVELINCNKKLNWKIENGVAEKVIPRNL